MVVKRSAVGRGSGGRGEQKEHSGLSGKGEYSDGTIMVGVCHYTFVKTHKKHNTKSEP